MNVLGIDSRWQSDWFRDDAGTLKPLLDSCNAFLLIGYSLDVIKTDRDMLKRGELLHIW